MCTLSILHNTLKHAVTVAPHPFVTAIFKETNDLRSSGGIDFGIKGQVRISSGSAQREGIDTVFETEANKLRTQWDKLSQGIRSSSNAFLVNQPRNNLFTDWMLMTVVCPVADTSVCVHAVQLPVRALYFCPCTHRSHLSVAYECR